VASRSPGAEAIGLDIGGSKIAAARVSESGEILARQEVPTPASDSDATLQAGVTVALGLKTPETLAVGIGAAGMIDFDKGVLKYAPNLAWRELGVRERFGDALELPALLDNDANTAAWGEFRFGAGLKYQNMLLVTVGTGIGGGIVFDGRLFRGAHGFAGEIGHMVVEPGGPMCGCGNRGCWEQVAAGRAIDRLAREAVQEHPHSFLAEAAGGDPDKVDGHAVTAAAISGDSVARQILSTVGARLGEGIAGLVNILDCDVVVVGGGASVAGDFLLDPAREVFAKSVEAADHRPAVPIVPASLGNEAGVIGAAILALEEIGR
jgi:glucokinase